MAYRCCRSLSIGYMLGCHDYPGMQKESDTIWLSACLLAGTSIPFTMLRWSSHSAEIMMAASNNEAFWVRCAGNWQRQRVHTSVDPQRLL